MAKRKIEIQFEGIDSWNRPVFVHEESNHRFGDVNNLFTYNEKKKLNHYKNLVSKNPSEYLEYFGRNFDCEPHGGLNPEIELIYNV